MYYISLWTLSLFFFLQIAVEKLKINMDGLDADICRNWQKSATTEVPVCILYCINMWIIKTKFQKNPYRTQGRSKRNYKSGNYNLY